jgi:hypothetical protein
MRSSLQGIGIQLSARERDYLDLRADTPEG